VRFTLVYDGKLKANGKPKHKQQIRRVLHEQLAELWKEAPDGLRVPGDNLCRRLGAWRFFPLASSLRDETVEISIIMLRPGLGAGCLIGHGGDIDNRLKTLFDSFRVPQDPAELPARDTPAAGENPLFCLLEDDRLITSLSVVTDRLLDPRMQSPDVVKLFIQVQVRKNQRIGGNMVGRLA